MLHRKNVNIKQLCNNLKKNKRRRHIILLIAVTWWEIWVFQKLHKNIHTSNLSLQKVILILKCQNSKVSILKKSSNYSLLSLIVHSLFLHLLDKKIQFFLLISSFNMPFKHRGSINILKILLIWVSFKLLGRKYK